MNWEYHLNQKVHFPRDFQNISCPGIRNGLHHTKHMIKIISKELSQIIILKSHREEVLRRDAE